MRFLIVLEQTEAGFSVQVPDLAIVTHGINIEDAKSSAIKAIKINLKAYQETDKDLPEMISVLDHFENPDLADLLFTYVNVFVPDEKIAV